MELYLYSTSFSLLVYGIFYTSGLTFKPTLTSLPNVNCLLNDDFNPGYLIICSGNALLSATRSGILHTIVGQTDQSDYMEGQGEVAKFRVITDALFLTLVGVLTVDSGNHCLRLVNRNTNQTSTYAGNCTHTGLIDGAFLSSTFYNPKRMAQTDSLIYLIDSTKRLLRVLNVQLESVSTIRLSQFIVHPFSITFASSQEIAYLTYNHGIAQFTVADDGLKSVAGTSYPGDKIGITNREVFDQPKDVFAVTDTGILIADQLNGKLKFLDTNRMQLYLVAENFTGIQLVTQLEGVLYVAYYQETSFTISRSEDFSIGDITATPTTTTTSTTTTRSTTTSRTTETTTEAATETKQTPPAPSTSSPKDLPAIVGGSIAALAIIMLGVIALAFIFTKRSRSRRSLGHNNVVDRMSAEYYARRKSTSSESNKGSRYTSGLPATPLEDFIAEENHIYAVPEEVSPDTDDPYMEPSDGNHGAYDNNLNTTDSFMNLQDLSVHYDTPPTPDVHT